MTSRYPDGDSYSGRWRQGLHPAHTRHAFAWSPLYSSLIGCASCIVMSFIFLNRNSFHARAGIQTETATRASGGRGSATARASSSRPVREEFDLPSWTVRFLLKFLEIGHHLCLPLMGQPHTQPIVAWGIKRLALRPPSPEYTRASGARGSATARAFSSRPVTPPSPHAPRVSISQNVFVN